MQTVPYCVEIVKVLAMQSHVTVGKKSRANFGVWRKNIK